MYRRGEGVVEKDMAQAAHWCAQAAEQGLMKAQYDLGVMNERGDGVEKDMARAAHWYAQAAEQGHEEATLICLFQNGGGRARLSREPLCVRRRGGGRVSVVLQLIW